VFDGLLVVVDDEGMVRWPFEGPVRAASAYNGLFVTACSEDIHMKVSTS
jgi:hypothetical protein